MVGNKPSRVIIRGPSYRVPSRCANRPAVAGPLASPELWTGRIKQHLVDLTSWANPANGRPVFADKEAGAELD